MQKLGLIFFLGLVSNICLAMDTTDFTTQSSWQAVKNFILKVYQDGNEEAAKEVATLIYHKMASEEHGQQKLQFLEKSLQQKNAQGLSKYFQEMVLKLYENQLLLHVSKKIDKSATEMQAFYVQAENN